MKILHRNLLSDFIRAEEMITITEPVIGRKTEKADVMWMMIKRREMITVTMQRARSGLGQIMQGN